MPIYEYRCPNGHTFEVFQRMTDAPVTVCETCGAGPVEKLLFPVAVHFKGSGFYSTDYGRGSRKAAGKDSDATATSSDGGGAEKNEQPAAKTDAKSSDTQKSDS
jgi:putative FmdB family regulatory protein